MGQSKINICKHCHTNIEWDVNIYKTVDPFAMYFYYCVESNNETRIHEAMDNLDLIEYLAKQRGLVV